MADVVESMELLKDDEWTQARRIRDVLRAMAQQIALRFIDSQLLEIRGDGILFRVDSALTSLQIAEFIQSFVREEHKECLHPHALAFRVGLHADRLLGDGTQWFGRGLGLVARVCALALPGEILLTKAVAAQLPDSLRADLRDFGDCYFKHASEPIRVFGTGHCERETLRPPPSWPQQIDARASLALLPLDTPPNDSESSVVASLFIDALTCRLSGSPELRVISQFSSARAKGISIDNTILGQLLGARFLVMGRMSALREQFRVHLELIDAATSEVLWAGQLQEGIDSLLTHQSAPIERVAFQLHSTLLVGQLTQLRYQPLPNLSSHDIQRAAVHLMHQPSRKDFIQAREMLAHLSERHPRSAMPKSWLAKWHILRVAQGWSDSTERDIGCARQEADRALSLDPDSSICATILGMVHGYLRHDFSAAAAGYRQALSINPNEAQAHLQMAALAGWQGRATQALQHSVAAIERAPLDPHLYYFYCLAAAAHLGAGEHHVAEQHAQNSLSLNSAHIATYKILMLAQALQGKLDAARATASQLLLLSPDFSVAHFDRHSPWGEHPKLTDFRHALRAAGIPSFSS